MTAPVTHWLLGIFATFVLAADTVHEGYLCNRPVPTSALALLHVETPQAPQFQATAEQRRCTRDSDCLALAGVCNQCWITATAIHRNAILHEIQQRETKENCNRPNLGPAVAYCGDGLCLLKASAE